MMGVLCYFIHNCFYMTYFLLEVEYEEICYWIIDSSFIMAS